MHYLILTQYEIKDKKNLFLYIKKMQQKVQDLKLRPVQIISFSPFKNSVVYCK